MDHIKIPPNITPLPYEKRRGRVPRRGYASIRPAARWQDALIGGNGTIETKTFGMPRDEIVLFRHEGMLEADLPSGFRHPPEPPRIAHALDRVRKLLLQGDYKGANDYAFDAIRKAGYPDRISNNYRHEGFVLHVGFDGESAIEDYLRTVDFSSGEAVISWTDKYGAWERRSFVSRPAQISVIKFTVPESFPGPIRINVSPTLEAGFDGTDDYAPRRSLRMPAVDFTTSMSDNSIEVCAPYTIASMDGAGYFASIRIQSDGNAAEAKGQCIEMTDCQEIIIATSLGWRENMTGSGQEEIRRRNDGMSLDYHRLLAEHTSWQSALMERTTVELGSDDDHLLTTEEMLVQEHLDEGFFPALVEKIFDMGRYFLLYSHGKVPYVWGHVNVNVNLQVASGVQTALPEMMETYFSWIESLHDNWRKNARDIFGFRGFLSSVHPDGLNGVLFHMTPSSPHHYWIAGAGWCYQPFWEYYQTTGDSDFAENRLLPALREIARFFDDYLSLRDEKGRYIGCSLMPLL